MCTRRPALSIMMLPLCLSFTCVQNVIGTKKGLSQQVQRQRVPERYS
jgi:hypothetical protein